MRNIVYITAYLSYCTVWCKLTLTNINMLPHLPNIFLRLDHTLSGTWDARYVICDGICFLCYGIHMCNITTVKQVTCQSSRTIYIRVFCLFWLQTFNSIKAFQSVRKQPNTFIYSA